MSKNTQYLPIDQWCPWRRPTVPYETIAYPVSMSAPPYTNGHFVVVAPNIKRKKSMGGVYRANVFRIGSLAATHSV